MLVYIEIEYNLAEKLQNKRDTKKGRIHLRLYKERERVRERIQFGWKVQHERDTEDPNIFKPEWL